MRGLQLNDTALPCRCGLALLRCPLASLACISLCATQSLTSLPPCPQAARAGGGGASGVVEVGQGEVFGKVWRTKMQPQAKRRAGRRAAIL